MRYTTSTDGIGFENLTGFFVDWPNPPSPQMHLEILKDSYAIALAVEDARVVGFANAISDGHLAAYIPLLEVLPAYRNRGVGSQLIKMMMPQLEGLYMIDLRCDEHLEPFYERLGFSGWAGSERTVGMGIRDFRRQSGTRKHDIGRR
jgi:GNAT superfamily N-acetyltransferase